MSQQLINQYLNEIDRLRKFSGSVTEGVTSEAFKDLLKTWARQLNWQFAAQYEFASVQKSRIRPDGTIRWLQGDRFPPKGQAEIAPGVLRLL